MQIVIAGAGTVGQHIAEMLQEEQHDVAMIDLDNERLLDVGERLDIRTLHGSANNPDILREAGIGPPRRRRAAKHRRRRERKAQAGLMILWDGSRHDWLEGRGPMLCLMASALDDTIACCAMRGGLDTYAGLCEGAYVYHPFAIFVPGILQHMDIEDICAAVAPRPLLREQSVNARNQLTMDEALAPETRVQFMLNHL